MAWLRGRGAVECLTQAERSTSGAISKIAITRWGGESYSLTLGKDGSVIYDGYCGMTRLGCHVGRLAKWRFDRLASLATDIGFFDLDASYESDATDQQVVFVAVTAFECEKAVLDYGMVGPSRLWALEEMISVALNDVEWRE